MSLLGETISGCKHQMFTKEKKSYDHYFFIYSKLWMNTNILAANLYTLKKKYIEFLKNF